MPKLQALLEQSGALHRHICPRQVLGARMGLLAGKLLNLELPRSDKRLLVLLETDGCFADGVSVATGCWLGRRTMRLFDYGKVAATFVDTRTEQAMRIAPHPEARKRAREMLPFMSKWQAYLEGYQLLSEEELLVVREVRLEFSLSSLISHVGARALCQSCGEEIINGREVVQGGQVLCLGCVGDAYCGVVP
jgi:formylmethanofuran dehydrogenase subunit E